MRLKIVRKRMQKQIKNPDKSTIKTKITITKTSRVFKNKKLKKLMRIQTKI